MRFQPGLCLDHHLGADGGGVGDAVGNAAVLTLQAVGTDSLATKNIVIEDSIAPTGNIVVSRRLPWSTKVISP